MEKKVKIENNQETSFFIKTSKRFIEIVLIVIGIVLLILVKLRLWEPENE